MLKLDKVYVSKNYSLLKLDENNFLVFCGSTARTDTLFHSFNRYTLLWNFFSSKNSAACTPPQEFFELWTKFSSDFLSFWKREQQLIAKQMYEEKKKKIYSEKVEGLVVKPAKITGLKLKLASSRKMSQDST